MKDLVTLWFDKDGVLAKYDYSLYEGEYGAPAPWLVRNAHVFKNLDMYPNMCHAVSKLYAETANVNAAKRLCNVRVLTAVSDGVTLSEHVLDGASWCERAIGLQPRDFYATAVAKESIPVVLRNDLTSLEVLFDDYTPNLRKWKKAGGTAVKVVNGINSQSLEFPCISVDVSADTIYQQLLKVVDRVINRDRLDCGYVTL